MIFLGRMNLFIGYGFALTEEDLQRMFPQDNYPDLYKDDEFTDAIFRYLQDNYKNDRVTRTDKLVIMTAIDEVTKTELFVGYEVNCCDFSYGTAVFRMSELTYLKQKESLSQFVRAHPEFDDDQIQADLCILASRE